MRPLAFTTSRSVLVALLSVSPLACFDPGPATRGLPCSEDAGCGPLSCEYGVCGGPVRCEAGAGVGDYCFTFETRELDVGAGIDALAVGTVDIDALPDIVVGNGDTQTIALVRNVGAGDFARAVHSQPLGLAIDELAIGAVDGAGWADVVTTSGGTTLATIPILPGATSTGEIGAPVIIANGLVGAARPQIGEFVDNGDALPDVAALVATGFDVFPQTAPATYDAGVHTEVAGSVDLQKVGFDANPVFVASSTGNSVVAHKRISGGAFAPTTTIDVGPSPSVFVIDDLDNDTFGDVLAVSASGEMWLTTGRDTTFAIQPRDPIAVYDLGWPATTLLAHNLDEDPEPELIVSGTTTSGRRDVYLFDNDGQGRPIYGGSLGIDDASSVVAADLDLDGVAEIVVLSQTTGKVRVARRAVAPPPPGGDESTSDATTGVDPTVDPSSPSDPSLTTSPMTTDPSGMTDPTMPGEDSGVLPSCPDLSFALGSACYGNVGVFGVSTRVEEIVVERIYGVEPTLIVLTEDGVVWTYPGSLFGTFDPMLGSAPFWVDHIPSGLAAGNIDIPFDPETPESTAVIVVTHDAGFTVFTPDSQLPFSDWPVGPSVAPIVGHILDREFLVPATGIALGTTDDALLRTVHPSMLVNGDETFGSEVVGSLTDIDLALLDDFDAGLVVASGLEPQVYIAPETEAAYSVGALIEGTSSIYTKAFAGFDGSYFATSSEVALEILEDLGDGLVVIYTEDVIVVSDFAAGNVDGAPGDELLAMIDYGDGTNAVRVWTQSDGGFYALADLTLDNLAAFAVTDVFGSGTADLLLATTDEFGGGVVLHLGVVQ